MRPWLEDGVFAPTDPRPASKRVVRALLCGAITRDADSFRDRALSRGLLIINKNLRVRQKPVSRSRKFIDDAKIHKGCSWDDVQAHPHYIADKEKWLCSDYDKECAKSPSHKTCCKDGCDNAAIHSACTEPQTAQFLWEEWRCGWPGWQEQYP